MTIFKSFVADESGVTSIEGTFIAIFFVGLLMYTINQALAMTIKARADKLAIQMVNIVAQRQLLFNGANLANADVNKMAKLFPELSKYSNGMKFDIFIEEVAYATGRYSVITLRNQGGSCTLNRPLNQYGFNLRSSYEKTNSVYRVVLCRKFAKGLFFPGGFMISASAVQVGHHH